MSAQWHILFDGHMTQKIISDKIFQDFINFPKNPLYPLKFKLFSFEGLLFFHPDSICPDVQIPIYPWLFNRRRKVYKSQFHFEINL